MTRATVTRKLNIFDPTALPSWVPAPGTFADIGLNTLYDVRPTGWPNSDIAGPFSNWSGGTFASDFGALGGYVVHGSGHLSGGTPIWAGVWVFDIASRLWVGRNIPAAPLLEAMSTQYNEYGESIIAETAGHTYAPHTYDGLLYRPAALGGGPNGQLVRACFAGAPISGSKSVHAFDLSSPSDPPLRVIDDIGGNSYPAAADDHARGGFWITSGNGLSALRFVNYSDWAVTQFSGVAFNAYGNQNLVYVPDRDCLVALGNDGTGGVNMSVRVCPIVSGVPQGWTLVSQGGTPPADKRCGGVWSTLIGCIVSYEAAGSYKVHKLAIPADLTGGTWTWSSETLVGVGGAIPGKTTSNSNGAWSRMIEVPALRCFLWADSVAKPMQAWRLAGM